MTRVKSVLRNIRRRYYTYQVTRSAASVGIGLTVNHKSQVTESTSLGNNVHFNGMTVVGLGNVFIGDNFHSGTDCLMISSIHNYDHGSAIPYDDTHLLRTITIEDNVWLGSRVIVLGGVTIGEGAIIQAGSVVVNSIPKYALAGGHPAKPFKYRNIEHYEALKQERKFL